MTFEHIEPLLILAAAFAGFAVFCCILGFVSAAQTNQKDQDK
tara:strand:- start:415 stop:540 length:126 start_codon:yes stop_codon:yes gene_type:complete